MLNRLLGDYTSAEVPFFDWTLERFQHSRNNYGQIGHFDRVLPVLITRELMVRKKVVSDRKRLIFIGVCIAMAIRVSHAFIEGVVSLSAGEGGVSFLSKQGYIWDAQSDMIFATFGAILSLVFQSKLHDRYVRNRKLHDC